MFQKGNNYGFDREYVPWNKGVKGYNTSWKGRHHSEETKEKIGKMNRKLFLTKQELEDLYSNKKLTLEEIAKKFNVHIETVRKLMIYYEIPRRKRGYTSEFSKKLWQNPRHRELIKEYFKKTDVIEKCRKRIIELNKDPEFQKKRKEALRKKIQTKEYRENLSEARRKVCQRSEYIEKITGKNNPNWRGGTSFEPYSYEFNKLLKGQIRKRDNFSCQVCGRKEEDLKNTLNVHHIDYDKKNNDSNNLISLCRKCNSLVNGKREYRIKRLKNKVLNND